MAKDSSNPAGPEGPVNPHEALIKMLSERILGVPELFYPEKYGRASELKQPCDIAWVVNRCVILMYCATGKKSYQKKKEHNMSQLHGWLRQWKSGTNLVGVSLGRRLEYSYDDIDYVIGISVVGGRDVWCEYCPTEVLYSIGRKLSVCMSLTDNAMMALAELAPSPRDMLFWANELHSAKKKVSEQDFITGVSQVIKYQTMASISNFKQLEKDRFTYKMAFDEALSLVQSSRNSPEYSGLTDIITDISYHETIWFALANATFETQLSPEMASEPRGTYIHADLEGYRHWYIASTYMANLEEVVRQSGYLDQTIPGIALMKTFDFGRGVGGGGIWAATPRIGKSVLEKMTAELRDIVVNQ